jgi:serine/threonine-protein kinase RsbW
MRLELAVALPHERRSVPIARHIVRAAMANLGVSSSCVYDIEVALSEACTNVVQHAGVKDQYEVRLNVDDDRCVLRVVDIGESPSRLRVLLLMRTLVDTVGFDSFPEQGTVVSLEKQLVYGEAAGG